MTRKQTILYRTDVALLALFAALAVTGGVVHWVLPPGSGGRLGGHPARRELLDLSRHEWGQVHFWIAAALVALVVVHLALHWGWIKACTSRLFRPTKAEPQPQPPPQHVRVTRRLGIGKPSGPPLTASSVFSDDPLVPPSRRVVRVRAFKRSSRPWTSPPPTSACTSRAR